jgi:Flp pilus assembly protein TadG
VPRSITGTTSRLARETRGQEIAEAALVLPIVFMIMLGIFWFGQAFRIYGTITHAAREGARAAVAPLCATCGTPLNPPAVAQNAVNALQNALLAAKLDPAQPKRFPVTRPALNLCTTGAAAPCDANQLTQAGVCVQNNVQLSGINSTGLAGCGVSVTFQYPYQFWLPFTSLNNQRIFVPAQAHMKMESR